MNYLAFLDLFHFQGYGFLFILLLFSYFQPSFMRYTAFKIAIFSLKELYFSSIILDPLYANNKTRSGGLYLQ